MKKELISALRNALARGEELGKAMQSLANAGYSIPSIEEAAREVQATQGTMYAIHHEEPRKEERPQKEESKSLFFHKKQPQIPYIPSKKNTEEQRPQQTNYRPMQQPGMQMQETKQKKKISFLLVLLISIFGVSILIILIGLLFGNKILELVFGNA